MTDDIFKNIYFYGMFSSLALIIYVTVSTPALPVISNCPDLIELVRYYVQTQQNNLLFRKKKVYNVKAFLQRPQEFCPGRS